MPTGSTSAARRWAVLLLASTASFMVVLDISIVNVALPSIRSSLRMSTDGMAWVINAYTITFAGFLLVGGRAGDLFGRREMYFVGLGLFLAGSLAGAIAHTGGELIAARAVQGIGDGVLSPTTLGIVTTTYTKESERSRALGVWSAVAGSGGAVGAVAGGVLTDLLSWRWVLAVNLPIGLLLWALAVRLLHPPRPASPVRSARDLDLPGALTVTAGLSLLTYGIVGTDHSGWVSGRTLLTLTLAGVLIAVFLAIERRSARPMMPLPVIRRPTVHLPVTISFLFGAASFSTLFFLSLYLQRVLGYSALRAGFGFLPLLVASVVGSVLTGRLLRVVPARLLILAGIVLQIVGNGWLGMVTVSGSYATHVLVPTIAAGLGVGLIMVALTAVTMAGVSPEETGLISGLLNTGRQFGGAVGLAVLSTVAASRTTSLLQEGSAAAPALMSGYARALLCAAIGMGIALAACLLMARQPRVRAAQTAATDREVADRTAELLGGAPGGAVAQTEVR
jgi:EmrB/QacA subfamily drug resistance transporter